MKGNARLSWALIPASTTRIVEKDKALPHTKTFRAPSSPIDRRWIHRALGTLRPAGAEEGQR